jgi:hypothetical protein
MSQILPKAVFGNGGSAYDYLFGIGDDSTRLEMHAAVNGYGYGIDTATVLSCTALIVYSSIAMVYVIYSTCSNWTTSDSWESIPELIALSLNSGKTLALENTGAEISTFGFLRRPVNIGVKQDRLQMILSGTHISKITKDEFCG